MNSDTPCVWEDTPPHACKFVKRPSRIISSMLSDRRAPHGPQPFSLTSLILDMNQPPLRHPPAFSERTLRKRAHDDLYALGNQSSPYGDLVKYVTVVWDSGEFTLEYVNPFSLLCLLAASSLCFSSCWENV